MLILTIFCLTKLQFVFLYQTEQLLHTSTKVPDKDIEILIKQVLPNKLQWMSLLRKQLTFCCVSGLSSVEWLVS